MKEARAREILRASRLRATPARLAVIILLSRQSSPISVLSLANDLRAQMDQVTVYRTLSTLTDCGITRQIDLRFGKALYELSDIHDHHHIVCTSCSRVEDFSGCSIGTVSAKALSHTKHFATINSHSLELFGLCKQCI